jgi:hypothetical protein
MLAAAALAPDTALVVPGVSGRSDVLADLRGNALEAVRDALEVDPGLVVVVAPGTATREVAGPVRASLAAAGVPDALLSWAPVAGRPDASTVGVAASVALVLLVRAGWTGPVRVVETAPVTAAGGEGEPRPAELRALGARVAGGEGTRVVLVVAGSSSARHGPDAPRADDSRAPAFDAAVLADVADGGPGARARLAALDPALAAELDVSGWAPWQVLLGAVEALGPDADVDARVLAAPVPFGAQHLAARWLLRTPSRARSEARA